MQTTTSLLAAEAACQTADATWGRWLCSDVAFSQFEATVRHPIPHSRASAYAGVETLDAPSAAAALQ